MMSVWSSVQLWVGNVFGISPRSAKETCLGRLCQFRIELRITREDMFLESLLNLGHTGLAELNQASHVRQRHVRAADASAKSLPMCFQRTKKCSFAGCTAPSPRHMLAVRLFRFAI